MNNSRRVGNKLPRLLCSLPERSEILCVRAINNENNRGTAPKRKFNYFCIVIG